MKSLGSRLLFAFIIAVLILGSIPITAYAATPNDVVLGNNYTLNSGETLNDDLLIIGGNVTLSPGSVVTGSVILIGGNMVAGGTVNGDVTVLGGSANLEDTFLLGGNLSAAGATVNRAPGAQITGEIYTEKNVPQIFTLPGGLRLTNLSMDGHPLLRIAGFFLRLFVWVLVAMLLAVLLPAHLSRPSRTALAEPVPSGGIGLLTVIVAPIVIILLAITICLIPVALLVAIALAAAWAFGLIAFGLEVGKRISSAFNRQWHPVVEAGLGTLGLMLILNGLESGLPCVGWIPKILVGIFGLGAVLLTQFGTKPYPPAAVLSAQNPVDILPPVSPADELPPAPPTDSN